MRPPEYITCHHTGHKKKCIDLCGSCPKWIQIQGQNPNTGEDLSEWKCADTWLPLLLIENSQQQRSTGAAVESFRNEMVVQNQQQLETHLLMMGKTQPVQVIGPDVLETGEK